MATIIPILFLLSLLTLAQCYFPPHSEGFKTSESRQIKGASLSYKETPICSTDETNTYSGYVRLPPYEGDANPHRSNLFFYYAKSPKGTTAPLTIYLSGGPGASSMASMTTGVGPCGINPESNSTFPNPWSWTRESNVLFIDQPVQTGFSYDELTNATIDYSIGGQITPANFEHGIPAVNHTFGIGVFGSQDYNGTVNSTANGARELWDFMQVWLNDFPEYTSDEKKIHIWTESFGGRFGPSYTAYFLDQNEKIGHGQVGRVSSPSEIKVETLGIHNGCSDIFVQGSFYPHFAYNNTYGVPSIDKQQYEEVKHNFTKPGGCMDLASMCRTLARDLDSHNHGNNAEVNIACLTADTYCYTNVLVAYALSGRDIHDLAAFPTVTMPPPYKDGFFNQAWVQEALGAPVNYTSNSNVVYNAFGSTGNALITRGHAMDDFASIMARGVKVNLVYGDRDYLCNWMGGENISLSIDHGHSRTFHSSGYADLRTNDKYTGGVVRQHGNLSFTRVFEAGHEVPAYQPETMFRIFSRIMEFKDIATGDVSLSGDRAASYRTRGPKSTFNIKNQLPGPVEPVCYTLDMGTTCTENQQAALVKGDAVVQDFVVQSPAW